MLFGTRIPFSWLLPCGQKMACCTSRYPIQVQCRKKGKGTNNGLNRKKKNCPKELFSFALQSETLYLLGQNYAIWPPLSGKGVWEIGDSCFLAQAVNEGKGDRDWELFWRAHPWTLPQEWLPNSTEHQAEKQICDGANQQRITHLTIKLVNWKKWQLYTKFHWFCELGGTTGQIFLANRVVKPTT